MNAEVVDLLKRGKERLMDKDHLVKNWANVYETANGVAVHRTGNVCRMCIVGAVAIEDRYTSLWKEVDRHIDRAKDCIMGEEYPISSPFTYEQVHQIYDLAIEMAEEEE